VLFDDRTVVLVVRSLDCSFVERRLGALFFFDGATYGIGRFVVYAYCTNSGDPCSSERVEAKGTLLCEERTVVPDCVT